MKKNLLNTLFLLSLASLQVLGQNTTFNPYSRYGIGELSQTTLAHNSGMGGAFIALKPDSTMPVFINTGNPASYPLIRLTTLEVGGRYQYNDFRLNNASALKNWGTYFSYGSLGFPMGRNGGGCFGIMPFSAVGYNTESVTNEAGIGDVTYLYNGNGGLNKAFLGYGIMPFSKRLIKFRTKYRFIPDSLKTLSNFQFKSRETWSKLLSDLSIGANANFIFGNLQNITRVVYPNSVLYNNVYRERTMNMNDFTGNFGIQTATTFDSIRDPKKKKAIIEQQLAALKAEGVLSNDMLTKISDSLESALPSYKKAMSERVKISFGFFGNIQNPLKVTYGVASYNYVLSGSGQEIIRDTALFSIGRRSTITLPLQQGFGIGFKKGERINIVADFAITDWNSFRYLGEKTDLVTDYRTSIGVNYVPEKYAAGRGAFWRKTNYRIGASYQTGYIKVGSVQVSDYFISAGLGLPVGIGRLSSMVNISAQVGQMGSANPALLKHNYFRVNFGFTFCDKWFQKFRYD